MVFSTAISFTTTPISGALITTTITPLSGVLSSNYLTKEIESSLTFDDDSYQNIIAESSFGVVGNTPFSMPVSLTCSTGGNLDISYSMVQSGSNLIPSWISLDTENSLLVGTTPNLKEDTTFTFYIKADSIAWPSGYLKSITIGVLKCYCNVAN
jgi:hypothetical protein